MSVYFLFKIRIVNLMGFKDIHIDIKHIIKGVLDESKSGY